MAISTNPLLAVPYLKYKQASKSLTLSGMDTGSCIVNDSATASITVTLPLAKPGTMFRFYVNTPFTIIVKPRPTDNIGNLAAGATYTLAAVVGTDLVLTCVGDSIWAIGAGNQLAGPGVIGPPTSGTTLTLNGATSATAVLTINMNAALRGIQILQGSSSEVGFEILDPGANASTLRLETTNSAANLIVFGVGSTQLGISASGGVVISAPTSTNALSVNGAASFAPINITCFAANTAGINFANSSTIGTSAATFAAVANKPGA